MHACVRVYICILTRASGIKDEDLINERRWVGAESAKKLYVGVYAHIRAW